MLWAFKWVRLNTFQSSNIQLSKPHPPELYVSIYYMYILYVWIQVLSNGISFDFFKVPPTQKWIIFNDHKSKLNSWMGRRSLIIITCLDSAQWVLLIGPLFRFLWWMVQLATINLKISYKIENLETFEGV
jgi:hypothetical protein